MNDWSGEVLVELRYPVRGDGPFGKVETEGGTQPGRSNPNGALSVVAKDGGMLGVKPHEVVRWWYKDHPDTVFVWVKAGWMPESLDGGKRVAELEKALDELRLELSMSQSACARCDLNPDNDRWPHEENQDAD
jgi:hypothetical protein